MRSIISFVVVWDGAVRALGVVLLSFETDFPSITWEDIFTTEATEANAVSLDVLQEKCLDKKRVREVIEQIKIDSEYWHDNTTLLWTCDQIMKELGL